MSLFYIHVDLQFQINDPDPFLWMVSISCLSVVLKHWHRKTLGLGADLQETSSVGVL